MCGNREFVRECQTDDCLIHPFRFGKDPARSGKGHFARQAIKQKVKKQAMNDGFAVYFK
jgi:hypothetical protein